MTSNITLTKWMIAEGYADARTLKRRINAMEDWIAYGTLLKADANAQYAAVIEIDLAEVAGTKIDEVFIGSCMTKIGHFRAAAKVLEGKSDIPTRLWISPPTKMDALILTEERSRRPRQVRRAHGNAGQLGAPSRKYPWGMHG
jgi:aconitate hydratase 2/2-methylisocitrate dehydratase